MRAEILASSLALGCALVAPAQAGTVQADLAAERRLLVQRLVADSAAAVKAVKVLADEREQRLFAELEAKDHQLRRERSTSTAVRKELATVTAERERLVLAIAGRDRQLAAEIAEYRKQVASIANSPDPRKRAALERYAEGDRAVGFEELEAILQAETKAHAAGWRELAALALDRMDRGEMDTAQVIPYYEKAQSLDPDHLWVWIDLQRLYQKAGRLSDARRAAEKTLALAVDDRSRSVAETELGDLLLATGDLAGAQKRFAQGLAIDQRLAAANPTSAQAQRDLSVSLYRLGDVLEAARDLPGARILFEKSLAIRERLADANSTSAQAQRDFSISLNRLGDVLLAAGELPEAQARFEQSLAIRERLVKAHPTSAQAQRDLSISLTNLGDVLVAAGDPAGARAPFEQSLAIDECRAAMNKTSAEAQRDLTASLTKLGDVLMATGDLAGAGARLAAGLAIAQRLIAASPTNAGVQRDLLVGHSRLGALPGGAPHLSKALEIALDLQQRGLLAPRDAWMIEDLRQRITTSEGGDG